MFLAPLTARSKVREVLRGLVATRQVHTISMGHAPHFYVAGTLPEFADPPTIYASASMPASAYFLRSQDSTRRICRAVAASQFAEASAAAQLNPPSPMHHAPRPRTVRQRRENPPLPDPTSAARPHTRVITSRRNQPPAAIQPARQLTRIIQRAASRPQRPRSYLRRTANAAAHRHGFGQRITGAITTEAEDRRSPSGGASHARSVAVFGRPGASATATPAAPRPPASQRDLPRRQALLGKPPGQPRGQRRGSSRKPALTAGTKAGNSKRFGFTARPKQETKKRG